MCTKHVFIGWFDANNLGCVVLSEGCSTAYIAHGCNEVEAVVLKRNKPKPGTTTATILLNILFKIFQETQVTPEEEFSLFPPCGHPTVVVYFFLVVCLQSSVGLQLRAT